MTDMGIMLGIAAFLGASMGSFITLITYRLPRDEPIGLTRSRCPHCKTPLGLLDLLPIISWALSTGRCRHCKARVSARYPLTELACALGTVLVVDAYGATLEALAIAGLWWSVVAVIVTDLEHYIILDEVQIAIVLFGALYHYALGTPAQGPLISAVVGLCIGLTLKYGFLYLRNKDGLGLGDVKLLFGAGIWLGSAASFVPFLFFSGLIGVVFGTLWRVVSKSEIFPFGPALAITLLAGVVWPSFLGGFWQLYQLLPQ